MAGSTELFEFIQKFNRIVGIFPSQQQNYLRSSIILIGLTQYLITTVAFLLFDATHMIDFGMSVLIILLIVDSIVQFTLQIWQSQNTFNYIKCCEQFIEKRE